MTRQVSECPICSVMATRPASIAAFAAGPTGPGLVLVNPPRLASRLVVPASLVPASAFAGPKAFIHAGEQLLRFFFELEQAVVGGQFGEQRDVPTIYVFCFDLDHAAEIAHVANVFKPDHGGVGGGIIGVRNVAQVLWINRAAVGGFAAGSDTFPVRNKGSWHGLFAWVGCVWRHDRQPQPGVQTDPLRAVRTTRSAGQ